MHARATGELHRASTPLELFFDLIFVVAIALNAAGLHHGIAENHAGAALLSYIMQFMVIWWAWMGFTWFASAFDADDVPYRLLVFLQMAGALVIAAGIPRAFDHFDFWVITLGYTLVRISLVWLWLRAWRANPRLRPTISRYMIGLVACQLLWISLLFMPKDWLLPLFAVFITLEMLVPFWAERTTRTPAHPEHINERYSLFTIIVLGESILATVVSIKDSVTGTGHIGNSAIVIVSAMLVMFSLWWMYFGKPKAELEKRSLLGGFLWGYGHYFIFASAAAIGAGFSLSVEFVNGGLKIPEAMVQRAIAIPVALYLFSLWVVHFEDMRHSRPARSLFPLVVVLLLATTALPHVTHTLLAIAALTCGLLAVFLHQHYDAGETGHSS